jgi:tight adherence protein B
MTLGILIVFVLLAALGLSISAFYFLIAVPAEKKALLARLESIQESSTLPVVDGETELFRQEILSHLPSIHSILAQIPLLIKIDLFIRQSGVKLTVALVLGISLITGIVCFSLGLLLSNSILLPLFFAIAFASMPFLIIAYKKHRRFLLFEEQFPDAIDLLSRSVRAGHAFTTGLELISEELTDPVAGEFRRTYEQQQLGLPLREALKNLSTRVPLSDVQVFVTALIIQRDSGGNLAEILDNLAQVIRERFRLMKQIRVFTAQGRISLFILLCIPPCLAFALYLINPGYISLLFTDPLGQRALAAAIFLQILGFFVIKRIIKPKL